MDLRTVILDYVLLLAGSLYNIRDVLHSCVSRTLMGFPASGRIEGANNTPYSIYVALVHVQWLTLFHTDANPYKDSPPCYVFALIKPAIRSKLLPSGCKSMYVPPLLPVQPSRSGIVRSSP